MKISGRSSFRKVAGAVGDALRREGIRAVLTGGGCASLYSRGEYQSEDLDFIIQGTANRANLDGAMATMGFVRRGDQYFHPESRFFVEFPRGPLGIGRDITIRPVELPIGDSRLLALSPVDSCRDRLAAFFFWNDRQGLQAAIEIALRHRLDVNSIRRWAESEGEQAGFDEFLIELKKRRRRRRTASATSPQ